MGVEEIVRQVAEQLQGEVSPGDEDNTWYIEVPGEDDNPAVPVLCYEESIDDGPAGGSAVLLMRAAVGDLDEALEDDELDEVALLAGLMQEGGGTWFARLYLDSEEEPPMIIAEAALPLAGLDARHAAHAVYEIAELALLLDDGVEEEEEA